MALTLAQIQALLSEAVAAGFTPDEVEALRLALLDRTADLSGADRIDIAFALANERTLRAAETFVQESARLRNEAITRGAAALRGISDEEWERLINDH